VAGLLGTLPVYERRVAMRWRDPVKNEVRRKKAFLFFPLKLNGETRWLEVAEWCEKFQHIADGWWGWYPIRWL